MPKDQKHAVEAEEDLVFLSPLFRKGDQRSIPALAGTPFV
jgi:hypothetical protein